MEQNATLRARQYANFKEMPESYLALFEKGSARSFYYSLPWFENMVQTALDEGDRLRIYSVEAAGSTEGPVAALPTRYRMSPAGKVESLQLSGLSNYYASLFGPVLDDSRHDLHQIVTELVRGICEDPLRWEVIDFKPLDADSPVFTELVRSFKMSGMIVQTYFCFGNWYLEVNGRSYQKYFETLPPTTKNTIKRKTKKFEQMDGARIEIVTDHEDLEPAIAAFEKVYTASWKSPEPYPLFIPGLIRACAKMGWLRLGVLFLHDEPVAAQLWIVQGETASIYKLAYDERFARLSAGSVLTARLMKHVIEVDQVREVDYLTGDDPYKKDWMSHRRERWGIMAFNPRRVKGLVGAIRHIGGRTLKRMFRSGNG